LSWIKVEKIVRLKAFTWPSPEDENRGLRMRKDFDRLTAKQHRRYAAPPVGRHRNEIAARLRYDLDNGLVGMIAFDLERLAGPAGSP
jgi:hypothetical protein